MPVAELYRRQAALLVSVVPFVAAEKSFALKGGTAINLFVRDLPRISVDLDLTYLPVADRDTSLTAMECRDAPYFGRHRRRHPRRARRRSRAKGRNTHNEAERADGRRPDTNRSHARLAGMRLRSGSPRRFSAGRRIQVVSFPDLYGGKIVAALDRQHPRDLFDVRDLLANEGISDELRRAFIVYLVSSNRPFAEILAPTRLDIAQEFARGFDGMTDTPVTMDSLLQAREQLIAEIVGKMPVDHKNFLVSLKKGEPEWALLGVKGAEGLPAVRWRLENLAKMDKTKREALIDRLRQVLEF